jgi:hypothetical protein
MNFSRREIVFEGRWTQFLTKGDRVDSWNGMIVSQGVLRGSFVTLGRPSPPPFSLPSAQSLRIMGPTFCFRSMRHQHS